MSVIIFRRQSKIYNRTGANITWRLHGQGLPQGSIPIRFVMTERSHLVLHDILHVEDGQYRDHLDQATAQGILRDIWTDLCDRDEKFWAEYLAFVVKQIPEVIPVSIKRGNKPKDLKNERHHSTILRGLVMAGANVNFPYEGKTALDYAFDNNNAIPPRDRDYTWGIINCLQRIGAEEISEITA